MAARRTKRTEAPDQAAAAPARSETLAPARSETLLHSLDVLIEAVPTWPGNLSQLRTSAILHHLRYARTLLTGKE